MRRRAFLLAQVMVLGTIALALVFSAFARTTNQMHLARRAMDTEQTSLMLDALEQLTVGQSADVVLTVPGWAELTARQGPAGWTLTARPVAADAAGPATRLLARP